MNFARFAPALAAALLLTTTAAFAATTTTTAKSGKTIHDGDSKDSAKAESTPAECIALQGRFDAAITSHENHPGAAKAKALRQEGGQLCASGKTTEGLAKLDLALNDIGVKGLKAGD